MSDAHLTSQQTVTNGFNEIIVKQFVPILCAAAMLFAGIVGARVLSQQEEIARALGVIQVHMAVVETQIVYINEKVKP